MKKITNLLYAAFVAVLFVGFVSCEDTAPEYKSGKKDLEGCYGVYFPTQKAAGEHTLDPTAAKEMKVVVMRSEAEGDAVVPVEAIAKIDGVVVDADSIFNIPDVVFLDGQTETTITITFPEVETAVKYELTLEVTDPAYASLYGSNPVSLSFSIFCVEWKWIGVDADGNQAAVATEEEAATVSFTEGWWDESFDDAKIKFYEVNGKRNYVAYREDGMWNEGLGIEFNFVMSTKADGEGKYAIDVKRQYLGFDYDSQTIVPEASAGAPVYFYDWYNYFITDGYNPANPTWTDADDFYTKHGGSYPRSYYDGMGGYYFNLRYYVPAAGGGWTPALYDVVAIVNGVLRQDFTTIVSVGETVEGVAPVTFAMGKDVASVKYTVLEGEVTNKVAKAYCDSIIADTLSYYAVVTPESPAVGLELEKSGVYTLVAVPFDADGVAQQPEKDKNFLAVPFTYVTAEETEDYAAVVTLGIEPTSAMYAKDGYTDVNSFQYYIYGKNIVEAKIALLETEEYEAAPEAYNEAVAAKGTVLNDSILSLINGVGVSDLYIGLDAMTSYTLVLWATNGYRSTVATAEYTTDGLPLEFLGTGTYTYTCMFGEVVEYPGYKLYKDPNYKNTYKIADWYDLAGASGINFIFTWDGESGVKVANGQWLGIGSYYAGEMSDLVGQEINPSYYDAETKTFYFGIGYYSGNKIVAYGYETFTLDEEGDAEAATVRQRRGINASSLNTQWGVREVATFGPKVAGLAAARATSKAVDFKVKSFEVAQKSMKISNKKIVVE